LAALAACSMLLSATRMNGQGPTCASAVVIAAPGTYNADGPSSGGGWLPACTNDDGTGADPATNSDWYTWVAPSNGVLIVGSITAGADTRVSVFSGTCGSLVCQGGDDDINALFTNGTWEDFNYRSRVVVPVASGTTYFIQWDNLWSTTAFQWNLAFSADPATGVTVISAFPYTQTFDGAATCNAGTITPCTVGCTAIGGGWTNNPGDWGELFIRAGATPSGGTGPDFGATTGSVTLDKYLYLEASLAAPAGACLIPYQAAVVTSPDFNTSAFTREPQVRFADHLFGQTMGQLIAQYQAPVGTGPWVTFVNKSGDLGNQWNTNPYTTLPLSTTSFRIRLIGIRGPLFLSDLGVDQVQVRERPDCTSPAATASVSDNCNPDPALSTFNVTVNVTSFGTLSGGPQTQVTIVPSSGASQVATALGNYVFGPYAFGTSVTFSLTHQSEPACNTTIPGSYFSCCGSTCATAFTPALGVNANTNMTYATCTGGASNAFDSGAPVPTSARWWAYTPATTGVYNINSCGQAPNTNNDTRVTVHTGTCGGLSLYTADDDGCGAPATFDSNVDAYLQSGTTYYIEWDNAWGVNTAHTWSLTGPNAPVAGDFCSGAIPLTMSATCTNTLVSSAGATAESPSCAAGVGATTNADVWMSFVATDDLAQIDITPVGTYYPILELLDGTCGSPTSLCCTFAGGAGQPLTLLRGGLAIGNTYFVRVGHAFGGGDGGLNQFNICVTEGVSPTPACTFADTPDYVESEPCGTLTNSFLCDAEPIVLGSLPFTFVIGGTIQAECNFRDRDFFVFTLPSVGTYQVEFTGQFASRIFFLDANTTCEEPLTQINTAGALACATGTITQSLAPGTYALMMTTDGIFNNLTCGTLNDYRMTITAVPDLDCGLAVPIVCGDPYGVALSGAGLWSITSCGFLTPGNEAIYLLDATVAGTYNLSVTAANGQFVDYFYKPTSGGCTPAGWTCIQDIASAGTSVDFNIATPGQYWILADAEDDAVSSNQTFRVFCPTVTSGDYCAPVPLACGASAQGQTSPVPGVFPPTACPYSVAPSTGGVNYWSYTAPADGEVALSTCGSATFDTRISVYLLAPDCDNLECVAKNDDGTGCPNFSSDVAFPVTNGNSYLVAVHGFGGDFGFYSMSVVCGPPCAPAAGNDRCSQAQALTPALDDGNGVPTPGDNTCAYGDENTGCDPFGAMQGVWYGFNSGPNSIMIMDLVMGTASGMNYALYDGGCSGLGALNEITCVTDGDGSGTFLPALTPGTDYLLYLWNNGGLSNEGDYDLLLRRPGMNDAAIDTILEPEGEICNTGLVPRVVLRNAGELDLTSVTINYDVDGNAAPPFAWSGDLAYQETDTVYLPTITTVPGVHTLNVATSQPNGTTDDLPANDLASKIVNVTGESAIIVIATDNNANQITWSITDAFGFTVATGGPYTGQNNQLISATVCLPTTFGTCYSLYLLDSGGDGLCCLSGSGYWELRTANNRLLLRDLFNSTPSGSISPPNSQPLGHEFCLPAGPSSILGSECNIFTNQLLNKVYTSTVPGALSYQFEFSDPDAGYRRRIAVPRPWVQFSEMQTSPLTPGTVYFCRARVDQGASGFTDDHFGSGCEMGLDVNNVPGCTQLIDNNTLPTHSCGATKRFGGSDKIWAVPVIGGTQYRFNFTGPIDPDGPTNPMPPTNTTRIILRTSYVCPLNWSTYTLVNGGVYAVKVEVFANGVWGGYCGATCGLNIVNPPAQQGRAIDAGSDAAGITMYPNPVHDGRVQLRIDGLTGEDQAIRVDIYDVYGKRVQATQYRSSGTVFNTVLELDGSVAAGVYLVNITVNGRVTTHRLSVM
jgi:hypothetical protein